MAGKSVNKVILLGHLGKDAETKFTPSGTSVTNFTLATNRRVKDQQSGEWRDETDWHRVVLWQAENITNYLLKGKQVYLEGRLQTRTWEDKDGKKNYTTEVICNSQDIVLLSGRGGDAPGSGDYSQQPQPSPVSMPRSAQRQQPQPPPAEEPGFNQGITDDDVPF